MSLPNCPERPLSPPDPPTCPDNCPYALDCEATDYAAGCFLMEEREAEAEDFAERVFEDLRLRAEE